MLGVNLESEYGEWERVPSAEGLRRRGRGRAGRALDISLTPAHQRQNGTALPEEQDFVGNLLTRARDAGELPTPHRLTDEHFTRFLTDFEQMTLFLTRSSAWAHREIDDTALDDDTQAEHPWESLARLLGRDLFATVAAAVTCGNTTTTPRVYGVDIPFAMSDEDHGPRGALLLVGPETTGVITIDAPY